MTTVKRVLAAALCLFAGSIALAQAQTAQIVCHGDSLTWGSNASSGTGAATGTSYPGVLAQTLGPDWRVTNVGTGGWTIDAMTNEAPQRVDSLFDPNLKQNVLIIFGGTNDLGGHHETAEEAYAKLIEYCASRKAAHPWKILVVTPPVAAYPNVYPPDFDSLMVRYGALIRKNWHSFADGIIDIQADPRLGTPGAEHNPVYFSDHDFTHLTDAGYAIIGNDAAVAVLNLQHKRSRHLFR
jgi:lysophospholipase L1-like esterase